MSQTSVFLDHSECADGTPCGPNASCTNTVGSYDCQCLPGFKKGDPPNCSKLQEYDPCPDGFDNDCASGLTCDFTSLSDLETTTCCSETVRCDFDKDCCVGVYEDGEDCPSGINSDCRGNLFCALSGIPPRYKCCKTVVPNPLGPGNICFFS